MKHKLFNKIVIFIASLIIILTVYTINGRAMKISANSQDIVLYRELNYKTFGDDVKSLQSLLLDLNFNIGTHNPSGNFDMYTQSAIKAIQRYFHINIDGSVGSLTHSKLNYLLKLEDKSVLKTLKQYQDEYLSMINNSINCNKVFSFNDNFILFKGNEHTILSSRNNNIPELIINHTSQGDSFKEINTLYTSKENTSSSSHFVIDTNGSIYQYIDIKYAAKVNDLYYYDHNKVNSSYIKSKKFPINDCAIHIMNISNDGSLTNLQLKSSILLHKYIINQISNNYNHTIPANRSQILCHSDLDPLNLVDCADKSFPWVELMNGLINFEQIKLN